MRGLPDHLPSRHGIVDKFINKLAVLFNPSEWKQSTKMRLQRALVGLPLLLLVPLSFWILNPFPAVPWAKDMLQRGEVFVPRGGQNITVPIQKTFYGVRLLDEQLSVMNMYFMPSIYGYDPASREQVISFLTDGGMFIAIWWVESVREGANQTQWFLRSPWILALISQVIGMGVIAPLYCFLYFVFSFPPTSMSSATRASASSTKTLLQRQQQHEKTIVRTASVFPAVLMGHFIPAYAMFFHPVLVERQAPWLFIWQLYPIYVSLTFHLSKFLLGELVNRTGILLNSPRTQAGTSGGNEAAIQLSVTRAVIGFPAILGGATWVYTVLSTRYSLRTVFIPTALPGNMSDLTGFAGEFLRWDWVFVFLSMLLWVAYLLGELKTAGVVRFRWIVLGLCAAASILLVGPGATLGMGWLWREGVVARLNARVFIGERRLPGDVNEDEDEGSVVVEGPEGNSYAGGTGRRIAI